MLSKQKLTIGFLFLLLLPLRLLAAPYALQVTITGNYKATSSAVLAWQDGGGGTSSYNVYRSEVHNGPYAKIQSNVVTTSFNDLGTQPGHTYYYVVTAVNNVGESSNSSEAGPAVIP